MARLPLSQVQKREARALKKLPRQIYNIPRCGYVSDHLRARPVRMVYLRYDWPHHTFLCQECGRTVAKAEDEIRWPTYRDTVPVHQRGWFFSTLLICGLLIVLLILSILNAAIWRALP